MWHAISSYFRKLKQKSQSLTFKLTFLFTGIMLAVLVTTTTLAFGSAYYILMREVQWDIRASAQNTIFYLEHAGKMDDSIFHGQNILPFVHVVVYNRLGKPILDNIPQYEPVPNLSAEIMARWSGDSRLTVSVESEETKRGTSYRYYDRWISPQGEVYYLQFTRDSSREGYFLGLLISQIVVMIIAGTVLSILIGLWFTNRVLSPLTEMKQTLKRIEVNEMGRRIDLPKTRDEQYELADTINRTLDRIEQGIAQQKQFVSDASHELRTPITVIHGYTDLLIRWGSSDETTLQESLQAIQAETEYMRQLIEHLLFIARASAGELKIDLRPAETSELVDSIWRGMTVANRHNHQLVLAANDPSIILADEAMFKQLLRIFLENAQKYTPEGKKITLSSRVVGERLQIIIADEGIGIAAKDIPNIFTRFYRVDSSRTRGTGGTGLGLAIAKDIIELHHAEVEVSSEVGVGTQFTLYFPLLEKS